MKEDFLALANSVKRRLEQRFDQEFLKGFYVYENLLKLKRMETSKVLA